jgi:hypothetical protein
MLEQNSGASLLVRELSTSIFNSEGLISFKLEIHSRQNSSFAELIRGLRKFRPPLESDFSEASLADFSSLFLE